MPQPRRALCMAGLSHKCPRRAADDDVTPLIPAARHHAISRLRRMYCRRYVYVARALRTGDAPSAMISVRMSSVAGHFGRRLLTRAAASFAACVCMTARPRYQRRAASAAMPFRRQQYCARCGDAAVIGCFTATAADPRLPWPELLSLRLLSIS